MRKIIFALALIGCTENNYYMESAHVPDAESRDAAIGNDSGLEHVDGNTENQDASRQEFGDAESQDAQGPVDATADAQVVSPDGIYDVTVTLESTQNCLPSYDDGAEIWTIVEDGVWTASVDRSATQGSHTVYTGSSDGVTTTFYDYQQRELAEVTFEGNRMSGFGRRPGLTLTTSTSCKVNVKITGVKR